MNEIDSGGVGLFLAFGVFAASFHCAPASAAAKMPLRVAYSSISGSAIVPFIALDQIDMQLVRALEQSGFFSSLQRAK